ADRGGILERTRATARTRAQLPAQDPAGARMAARARASALPAAAAERGERLGGHHAALGFRAVYECAVVLREAALRARSRACDARELQRPVPSLLGGPRRISPRPSARRLCVASRTQSRLVSELRE